MEIGREEEIVEVEPQLIPEELEGVEVPEEAEVEEKELVPATVPNE